MIRESNEALLRTNALLEAILESAENANRAKSIFLANMSHELRTPLHGILSFSRFGIKKLETAPKEKLAMYFDQINQSGTKLLNLLNDLLDLSKLSAGKMEYNMQRNDISKVIDAVRSEFDSALAEKNITLIIEKPPFCTIAFYDEVRIGQVIGNLVSNAIKFTQEGGRIRIYFDETSLEDGEPAIMVSIEDDGIGIPESELSAIFEKFRQSSLTSTGAGGTGLGLAICDEIIHGHGGRIWAENNPQGKGAIMRFLLPVNPKGFAKLPVTAIQNDYEKHPTISENVHEGSSIRKEDYHKRAV
jgi:signal transduction histidine kinase